MAKQQKKAPKKGITKKGTTKKTTTKKASAKSGRQSNKPETITIGSMTGRRAANIKKKFGLK